MPEDEKKPKPIHAGHRERMQARVREHGLESLAEHEALEYILYFTIPRQNTNPIAHALLDRFGTFADVLEASEKELATVPGVGPVTARFLTMLYSANLYYLTSRTRTRKRLAETEDILNYLIPKFRGVKQEKLLLLCLDDHRKLLRSSWVGEGNASRVDLDLHRIGTEAFASGASYLILAHNHPDGVVLPSQTDINATRAVQEAMARFGIRLLDHIILGGDEYVSLRETHRL